MDGREHVQILQLLRGEKSVAALTQYLDTHGVVLAVTRLQRSAREKQTELRRNEVHCDIGLDSRMFNDPKILPGCVFLQLRRIIKNNVSGDNSGSENTLAMLSTTR